MITGAHSIIYSSDAKADMDFFKNILHFDHVDAGNGWLIFGLPPSEIAIHPSDNGGQYGFYLMCDDIDVFVKEMAEHQISCSEINAQRWGLTTTLILPGGGKLGIYEPKHARPGI